MKYILQLIAAPLYSVIIVGLLAAITIYPLMWILSLPIFWMVIVLIFLFGIIQSLISLAQGLITFPYVWIVKDNAIALLLSCITIIVGLVYVDIHLWKTGPDGFWQIIAILVLTILLIEIGISTMSLLIKAHSGNY